MALLVAARWLVARVRFGRWRGLLGTASAGEPEPATDPAADQARSERLARAVERAAARLPGESKCLAQAIALQWLLRRRGLGGTLTIGVRAGQLRGRLDDLHAWVSRGGKVLIGDYNDVFRPLYIVTNPPN
jgi:hypothetical protein